MPRERRVIKMCIEETQGGFITLRIMFSNMSMTVKIVPVEMASNDSLPVHTGGSGSLKKALHFPLVCPGQLHPPPPAFGLHPVLRVCPWIVSLTSLFQLMMHWTVYQAFCCDIFPGSRLLDCLLGSRYAAPLTLASQGASPASLGREKQTKVILISHRRPTNRKEQRKK